MPNQANPTRQKSYRPARRPPAYLRTKSGCLTCRKRKKKCDEQRITCGNCARRWIECVWPLPTASGSPEVDRRSNLVSSTDGELARLPSAPKDALESFSAGKSGSASPSSFDVELAAGSETLRLTRGPSMMETYLGEATDTDSHIFDLLQTKWLRQLIRPLASDSVIELYHRESMVTAMSTPFFMQALLACCAFEYPAHDAHAQQDFQCRAETLYVHAVAGLRQFLELKGSMVLTSAVSRTVLMLCIFERARPLPSSGVVTHLSGLAKLVHTEAIETTSDEALTPEEKLMRRVTLEAFIFHSTTSIPFQPRLDQEPNVELALGLAERALKDMFSYDTPEQPESPVLGVTPELFLKIREISLMHLKHGEEHDPIRYLHFISEIETIEEKLAASRHHVSNEYAYMDMDTKVSGNHRPGAFSTDTVLNGPKFYIVAAKILLADISKRYNQAPVYDMHELVREGMGFVSQLQPSVDYYAEYYSWPIQVLARFVSCQQDRDLLVAKIQGFWEATRCGTMRRIADILTVDNDKPSLCG